MNDVRDELPDDWSDELKKAFTNCENCEVKTMSKEDAEEYAKNPEELEAMMRFGKTYDLCNKHNEEFKEELRETADELV